VLLPLLPIGGNILSHWIDGQAAAVNFRGLFGDGELLVLATVVAAAGIGDLVFDLRRDGRSGQLRDAIGISFALVVVVVSVLMFGLVSLERESGGCLRTNAASNALALTSQASGLSTQASAARAQATQLLSQ
jgi:hypothetical protein